VAVRRCAAAAQQCVAGALGCVRQRARRCAAVRVAVCSSSLAVSGSALGSVRLSRLSGSAAVCGSAAVVYGSVAMCGSVFKCGSVCARQCVASGGSAAVRQCAAVREKETLKKGQQYVRPRGSAVILVIDRSAYHQSARSRRDKKKKKMTSEWVVNSERRHGTLDNRGTRSLAAMGSMGKEKCDITRSLYAI
jgi:hypothetical protein